LAAPRLLAQGHSAPKRSRKGEGEACALAPDPTNADQFVTGGDDGSVRVWSISKQRMIAMRVLPQPVTSLAYTNDGAHLAAGCEGGGVHVLHADSLADALVFSLAPYTSYGGGAAASAEADADAAGISRLGGRATFTVATLVGSKGGGGGGGGDAIGVLSYSPDDTMLAVGLASGAVEILAVGSHYRRLHSCVGHAAPVLHLDWSIDGQYVQTCCARCEYAFWEAQTGARVMQLGSMCDVAWATWTAPLGLPVQGVYPKLSDGSDIHAAHRSPDGRLLVTCDEFRKVNLFRHPCGPGSAACRAVAAHASRVGAVRFSADGRYVISIGGPDLSVLVWKVAGPS
jgi:microtubule-associated protein-like 6